MFTPYETFGEKYPDEVIVFNDGRKGGWTRPDFMHVRDGEVPRYSFASEVWKSEICGMLREIVRRINESDLAETIVGYFFFSLCYEWSWFWDYDAATRCMDYSPAMRAATCAGCARPGGTKRFRSKRRPFRASSGAMKPITACSGIPGAARR